MKITGTTTVYFTIGQPVTQVRAPELFNHVFNQAGIDAVVVPAQVGPDHLESFVQAALASPSVGGFYVAIPHKAPMLHLADRLLPAAQVAGATNAVRRGTDGKIEADLLDGEGFLRALGHFGVDPKGSRALIVGAGGAGRAIGASIAGAGADSIHYFDTGVGKAESAASDIGRHFSLRTGALQRPDPAGMDLVVNASPAGLKPDDPPPVDVLALDRNAAVVDIIMKPQPTPFVRLAREHGHRAFPGYEMLIQQVPLYLRFFGHEAAARHFEQDLTAIRAVIAPRTPAA